MQHMEKGRWSYRPARRATKWSIVLVTDRTRGSAPEGRSDTALPATSENPARRDRGTGRQGRGSDPDRARSGRGIRGVAHHRSEEHTSELQSLMRISYAVFCLKKQK